MSSWSASSRLVPTSCPWAARKVKTMPPPMSRRSALPSRLSMTPSLSDTFDPPRTTAYGRAGSTVSRRSTSTSASTRPPAACGSRCATSYTLACLRCTTPKPSETKTSASAASSSAKAPRTASSLLVSPGLKRRFSSSATSPSASAPTTSCAEAPTVSVAKRTSRPSSSPRRAGDGTQRVAVLGGALGAAEVRDDDHAGAGVGEAADRRHRGADAAVVGDRGAVERDVQVAADEHAPPAHVAAGRRWSS